MFCPGVTVSVRETQFTILCSPVVTSCFHGDRVGRRTMAWNGDEVGSLSGIVGLHTG